MSRIGKIARLPEPIREQINHRLQDGENGQDVIGWLNASEEVKAVLAEEFEGRDVNDSNLSAWRLGGFRDWETQQAALLEARRVVTDGTELWETGDKALADKLAAWMMGRYVVATRKLLEDGDDADVWKLTREICHDLVALRRGDHGAEWLRIEQERLKLQRQKNARERKKAKLESGEKPPLPPMDEEEKERCFSEIFGTLYPHDQDRANPRNRLLPYQRRWADDQARWKFGLMSRQSGKDFCSAEEGVRDCFLHEKIKSKTDWLIVAPSERQSVESLGKWKEWTTAYKLAIADVREEREGGSEALLKSVTIVFPHGSRVIAVPGRPDTVRGYSANVLLTEFAFFENPEATWRAIIPTVTNPLRGGVKKVRLITTPNGIGNKAYEIWAKNYKKVGNGELGVENSEFPTPHSPLATARWSCHFVDIYTAVKDGLPLDIEELKAAVDDPEGWAQEFECQFLDQQTVLLPYELIASCESAEATATLPPDYWAAKLQFPIDMGIDFGRRQDLTVCWSNAQLGDVSQTIEVLELAKMSTPEQIDILRPRLKQARRVCLDYTGAGIGMGDYLVREFKEWKPAEHKYGKIELCVFSQPFKAELFSKLRMAFDKRNVRVPISRSVREDLHSVNRVSTASGGVTYRAPHSADGHADRCTALALALRAGHEQPACGKIYLFPHTRRNTSIFQ